MKTLREIINKKPYLAWYVKDIDKLSEASIMEHIYNYGGWDDYLKAEEILGIQSAAEIFNDLKNTTRTNLKPKTINYFEKYYQKYA